MKKTPTYEIVNVILRRGNEPGLITEWFAGMRAWAEANTKSGFRADASALRIWLGIVRARPFYTAEELSPLWPALQLTLGLVDRLHEAPSPNRLANELNFYGLPTLRDENKMPFIPMGGKASLFIVEHVHRWRDFPMTQEEFGNVLLDG